MTSFNRNLLVTVCAVGLAGFIATPAVAQAQTNAQSSKTSTSQGTPTPPEKVAKDAVKELLAGLDGHRKEFSRNPKGLYELVDRVLIPLIDVKYTAQLVVGRPWRNATDEQKQRFITAFKTMLIQTYGNALLGFSGDNVEFLPLRAADDAKNVTFKALAVTDQGDKIPVNLDLHLVDGQWKVYNGSVGSLSFVTNYRAQFRQQIKQGGFEQLIQRMEKRYNVDKS